MPKGLSTSRKRRTREHVIADLGVNFVERQLLLCGHSLERIVHDYGIDGMLFTYDQNGEVDNDWIPLQIKATEHAKYLGNGRFLSFRVDRKDLRSWLTDISPVILIVYDAKVEKAFWLYVQAHFGLERFRVSIGPGKVTVRIPTAQRFDPKAIHRISEIPRCDHRSDRRNDRT